MMQQATKTNRLRSARWWKTVVLITVVTLVSAACTSEEGTDSGSDQGTSLLTQIQDRGTLRVGITLAFEPQSYRDSNDEPAGYDVELLEVMASDLGVAM